MTLVELLVVTVLLSILVSTAIPVISPNNDSRKIREASRGINAYLAAAQAKAIETGRPYGVEFTRLSDTTGSGEDNGACTQLTQIEVPPYFSGIDSNSVARIRTNFINGRLNPIEPYTLEFLRRNDLARNSLPYPGFSSDLFPPSMIRPNDVIEIKGERFYIVSNDIDAEGYCRANDPNVIKQIGLRAVNYQIDEDDPTRSYANNWNPIDFVPGQHSQVASLMQVLPYLEESQLNPDSQDIFSGNNNFWTEPTSYRIERQATPTSAEPLQLPAGMAIDLTASGVDLANNTECRFYQPGVSWNAARREFNTAQTAQSPRVIFTPSGQTFVLMPGEDPKPVTGSLSLCVGRVELVSYEPYLPEQVSVTSQLWDDPIDLRAAYQNLGRNNDSNDELRELTDQYNWLNMDTRWVVISGKSGSIITVANSFVNPNTSNLPDLKNDNRFGIDEQFRAALQNAPTRITAGGR